MKPKNEQAVSWAKMVKLVIYPGNGLEYAGDATNSVEAI
jgi:hypothetical protein